MMTEADRAVLDESYRNTRMGREAINVIIGKVEDDDLALDLNRQACKFIQLEEKLQKEYHKAKETPPEDSIMNPDEYAFECQHRTSGGYDDPGKCPQDHRIDEDGEEKQIRTERIL